VKNTTPRVTALACGVRPGARRFRRDSVIHRRPIRCRLNPLVPGPHTDVTMPVSEEFDLG